MHYINFIVLVVLRSCANFVGYKISKKWRTLFFWKVHRVTFCHTKWEGLSKGPGNMIRKAWVLLKLPQKYHSLASIPIIPSFTVKYVPSLNRLYHITIVWCWSLKKQILWKYSKYIFRSKNRAILSSEWNSLLEIIDMPYLEEYFTNYNIL